MFHNTQRNGALGGYLSARLSPHMRHLLYMPVYNVLFLYYKLGMARRRRAGASLLALINVEGVVFKVDIIFFVCVALSYIRALLHVYLLFMSVT